MFFQILKAGYSPVYIKPYICFNTNEAFELSQKAKLYNTYKKITIYQNSNIINFSNIINYRNEEIEILNDINKKTKKRIIKTSIISAACSLFVGFVSGALLFK